uniref:Protein argonaute N-terminal domain-containing protein n=1 Tax=Romanomermis culicivorax TaxID=13658 RepID=A0A915JMB5_ROMCU
MSSTGKGRGRGRANIPNWSPSNSTGTGTPIAQRTPGGLSSNTSSNSLASSASSSSGSRSAASAKSQGIESVNLPVVAPDSLINERMNSMTISTGSFSSSGERSTSSRSSTSSESGPARSISQHAHATQDREPIRRPLNDSPIPKIRPPICKLPMRPDFGTQGQKINLLANHFEIKMPKELTFHHYDVLITEQNTPVGRVEWTGGRVPKHTRDEMRDVSYKVFAEWNRKFTQDFFAFVYDRQQHVYSCVYIGQRTLYKVLNVKRTTLEKNFKRSNIDDEITAFNNRKFKIRLLLNAESPQIKVSMEEIRRVLFNECDRDRSPLQILDLLSNQMLYLRRFLNNAL